VILERWSQCGVGSNEKQVRVQRLETTAADKARIPTDK
jgi:hypothetical protein